MRILAIICVATFACGSGNRCPDPQGEGIGIEWDRLSGRIAYARWEHDYPPPESHGCIYLIDAAARRIEVLHDVKTALVPGGWAKDLAFRADRSTLSFAAQAGNGRWQLHDLSLSSGLESVLFADPQAHHFAPAWSPDGRVAYVSNGPLGHDIYVDAEPVQSDAAASRVAWISASAFIASIADDASAGTLYSVDLAKHSMTAIVPGWAGSPAVDPAGRRVAYEHPDAEGWSIWVANVDSTNPTRLTRGFSEVNAAWSADGESILFARSGQGLFLYHLASGALTQVTRRPVDSMAWAP